MSGMTEESLGEFRKKGKEEGGDERVIMDERIKNMIRNSKLPQEEKNILIRDYTSNSVFLLPDNDLNAVKDRSLQLRLTKHFMLYSGKVENILRSLNGGYRNLNMNAKDVKELCKAHQIKLSRVVNDKRVAYTKKELITKLKRKKLL